MIFNCGPTFAERTAKRSAAKEAYLTQWHPFFCLWPRRVGYQCVWLETIRRKGRIVEYSYSAGWVFEYRLSVASTFTSGVPHG